jgi:hypothetical protein
MSTKFILIKNKKVNNMTEKAEKKEDTKCDYGYKNAKRSSSKLTWVAILVFSIIGVCVTGLIAGFILPAGEPAFVITDIGLWTNPNFLLPIIAIVFSILIIFLLGWINARLCKRKVEAS